MSVVAVDNIVSFSSSCSCCGLIRATTRTAIRILSADLQNRNIAIVLRMSVGYLGQIVNSNGPKSVSMNAD